MISSVHNHPATPMPIPQAQQKAIHPQKAQSSEEANESASERKAETQQSTKNNNTSALGKTVDVTA